MEPPSLDKTISHPQENIRIWSVDVHAHGGPLKLFFSQMIAHPFFTSRDMLKKHGGDALLWVSLVAAQRDFSRRAEALIRTTARSSELRFLRAWEWHQSSCWTATCSILVSRKVWRALSENQRTGEMCQVVVKWIARTQAQTHGDGISAPCVRRGRR